MLKTKEKGVKNNCYIAIQRGHSHCILGTIKDSRKMDKVYHLYSIILIFHLLSDNDIYLFVNPVYRPNKFVSYFDVIKFFIQPLF